MVELIQISIMSIFAKLLKFLFEIGTSYFVAKETYGEFALLLSYIIIYIKIATFGIPKILVREVHKAPDKKSISTLLFNSALLIFTICTISYLIISLFAIKYLSDYPQIFIITLANSLLILYSTYLRSIKRVKEWIFFQDISLYLFYFATLGGLYLFTQNRFDILFILNIYTLSILGAFILIFLYIKFFYHIKLLSRLSIPKLKYLYSHSFPVLFTGLAYLVISRIDIIMLSNYVGLDLVGEYNIISRITLQVLFFNQVIVAYYYPRLAERFIKGQEYHLISRYNTKFVLLSFFSVIGVTGALLIAIKYFSLFEFLNITYKDELYLSFLILAFTQIIYSAISFYGNMLIYIHKQKIEYINSSVVLCLAIGLNFILIPPYGVVGASIATSIALILGNLFQMGQVKYFTGSFFISVDAFKKGKK